MLWTPLCEVLGCKDGIEAPSYELDSHVVTGLGRDLSMHMLGPKTMASARRTAHMYALPSRCTAVDGSRHNP